MLLDIWLPHGLIVKNMMAIQNIFQGIDQGRCTLNNV